MYSVFFIIFVGMGLLTANWFIGIGGCLLFTLFAISEPREKKKCSSRSSATNIAATRRSPAAFFPACQRADLDFALDSS